MRAYLQYNWSGCKSAGEKFNPEHYAKAEKFKEELGHLGIKDIARWSLTGTSEGYRENDKSFHAIRNTEDVNQADMVITICLTQDSPFNFWGSIAIIAYAIGRGLPCYVLAPDDCVIWKNHILYHPLVKKIGALLEITLSGKVDKHERDTQYEQTHGERMAGTL